MKASLFIISALLFYSACAVAQNSETIKITGSELSSFIAKEAYRYPAFMRSKVYFNSGDSAGGKLNYNYLLQSMQFIDNKGDTLVISDETEIKHISIGLDTFFYDNGYYEWIASSATARLARRLTFKEISRALIGAFGTSSPSKNVQSVDRIVGSSGIAYRLAPNEVLTLVKETKFYISSISGNKNNFVLANKKNIAILFPQKKVEDFIKENKINLNKEEDLVDLLVYVSKANK